MAEIAQYENSAKRHEKEPDQLIRMTFDAIEDRHARSGSETREAPSPTGLITRKNQREMLEGQEKGADLPTFRTRQGAQMAIHIEREACIDSGDGKPSTTRKEHLGRRLDEGGLATMKNAQADRGRSVAGQEASIEEEENCKSEKRGQHASRIPETDQGALASAADFMVGQCPRNVAGKSKFVHEVVSESGKQEWTGNTRPLFRIHREARRPDRSSPGSPLIPEA